MVAPVEHETRNHPRPTTPALPSARELTNIKAGT